MADVAGFDVEFDTLVEELRAPIDTSLNNDCK